MQKFAESSDYFTRVGNDDIQSTMTWHGNDLLFQRLAEGWDEAGLVQAEPFQFMVGMTTQLDFKLLTNTVGTNTSTTLLNYTAAIGGLPVTPALAISTYGFVISGGKAAIQNSFDGAQVFPSYPMRAFEHYLVTHKIRSGGRMEVAIKNRGRTTILGSVQNSNGTYPDFRDYWCRLVLQAYYTDTIEFQDFRIVSA